jgi:DNA polymerase III sliding clamp (beta) subunit (PCNA family)
MGLLNNKKRFKRKLLEILREGREEYFTSCDIYEVDKISPLDSYILKVEALEKIKSLYKKGDIIQKSNSSPTLQFKWSELSLARIEDGEFITYFNFLPKGHKKYIKVPIFLKFYDK